MRVVYDLRLFLLLLAEVLPHGIGGQLLSRPHYHLCYRLCVTSVQDQVKAVQSLLENVRRYSFVTGVVVLLVCVLHCVCRSVRSRRFGVSQ